MARTASGWWRAARWTTRARRSMWLGAFRAWVEATGGLPVPVTVLIEGEEEIGSPSLEPSSPPTATKLAADVAVISDTAIWDIDTPAITTRLRGLRLHGGAAARGGARPAFRPVRRRGAERRSTRWCARCSALHDDDGPRHPARLLRRRRRTVGRTARGMGGAELRRGGLPRPTSACSTPPARPGAAGWSGAGRGRPATSTASGAAMPGRARKP